MGHIENIPYAQQIEKGRRMPTSPDAKVRKGEGLTQWETLEIFSMHNR